MDFRLPDESFCRIHFQLELIAYDVHDVGHVDDGLDVILVQMVTVAGDECVE